MIKRLFFTLFITFAAPVALAQTNTATPAAQAPAKTLPPGFEHVAGAPETDKVDANQLVVVAYIAFFVCMFGYIVYVARSQSAMAKEMAELNERIRRAEKK